MDQLLSAVLLYLVVFGIDYLFYMKQKSRYNYVSRRTYALFISAQVLAVWYFYQAFEPFLRNFVSEMAMLSIFLLIVFGFTYTLIRDQIYICSMSSRTLRCLTPYYVFVKGAEIVFQQLMYLAIALSLASLLGTGFLTYAAFLFILLVVHVIVILGGDQQVVKSLTFGLAVIAVPTFYIFTELHVFWPAVYLHSLMYIFYWLVIADFTVQPGQNSHLVKNSG